MRKKTLTLCALLICCCILLWALTLGSGGWAADTGATVSLRSYPIVLTNLRNTVTNFGSFGTRFGPAGLSSKPGERGSLERLAARIPFPSCEWPAGSKNLYLYDGEIWVGALVSGDTAVTTGRFSGLEWSPLEGIAQKWGDEAFSDLDTYTRYDDPGLGLADASAHLPLGVRISQRTFAWEGADFIVHDLLVENTGFDDLDDVYLGFCWDFDISSNADIDYASDDLAALDQVTAISYMFDDDGDAGRSPGYVGGKFLNTPLSGYAWWSDSQDPENDAQRYRQLSGGLMADPTVPDNYRLLQTAGPFDLPPGRTIPLRHVLAIGDGISGLKEAVADAEAAVGLETVAQGDSVLLDGGPEHVIPVSLGQSKRSLAQVQFAVDWEFCTVGFILVDPHGTLITPDSALSNPLISYTAGPHRKSYDIADPMLGEWQMRISYLSGPGQIDYRHAVNLSDVPYDFGLPMDEFYVYSACLEFCFDSEKSICPDSFFVDGHFTLKPEADFDPDTEPVIVRVGSYQQVIPPGSFQLPFRQHYSYQGTPPGIVDMSIDFSDHWFEIFAQEVDLSGTENPVLVRLVLGQDTGLEDIPMDTTYSDSTRMEWRYYIPGKSATKRLADDGSLPQTFSLRQNYPNPFNAQTSIEYTIGQQTEVSLVLYNIHGQRVAVLAGEVQAAGRHRLTWNGTDDLGHPVASGIYFCRLQAGALSQTRKLVLLR